MGVYAKLKDKKDKPISGGVYSKLKQSGLAPELYEDTLKRTVTNLQPYDFTAIPKKISPSISQPTLSQPVNLNDSIATIKQNYLKNNPNQNISDKTKFQQGGMSAFLSSLLDSATLGLGNKQRELTANRNELTRLTQGKRLEEQLKNEQIAKENNKGAAFAGSLLGYAMPGTAFERGTSTLAKPLLNKIGSKLGQKVVTGSLAGGAMEATEGTIRGESIGDIAKRTAIGAGLGAGAELLLAGGGKAYKYIADKIKSNKPLTQAEATIIKEDPEIISNIDKQTISKPITLQGKLSKKVVNNQLPDDIDSLQKIIADIETQQNQGIDVNLQLFAEAKKKLERMKTSKYYENTITNSPLISDTAKAELSPEQFKYSVISEKQSVEEAKRRLASKDMDDIVDEISKKEAFANSDTDVAMTIAKTLEDKAIASGEKADWDKYREWQSNTATKATAGGRGIQAFYKWSRTPQGIVNEAQRQVNNAEEVIRKKNPKKYNKTQKEIQEAETNVDRINKESVDEVANTFKKESLSPEQQLANKIKMAVKPKTLKEQDMINMMVKELFTVAKESPIEVEPLISRSSLSKVSESIKNREQYVDTWNKAKEIVKDYFADNQDAQTILEDYFEKGIKPPYSLNTLKATFNQGLKELNIDIGKVIKNYYIEGNETRENLVKYLVEKSGLQSDQAQSLANAIDNQFRTVRKQKSEQYLKNIFKDNTSVGSNQFDNIEALSNTGAFVNENYSSRVFEKLDPKLKSLISERNIDFNKIITEGVYQANYEKKKFIQYLKNNLNVNDRDAIIILSQAEKVFDEMATNRSSSMLGNFAKQAEYQKRGLKKPPTSKDPFKRLSDIVHATEFVNDKFANNVFDKLPKAIRQSIKDSGIDMRKLVINGYTATEQAMKQYLDDLASKTKLNPEQLQNVINIAKTTFEKYADESRDSLLKAKFRTINRTQNKTALEKTMELINLGAYNKQDIVDAIKQKNNMPVLTNDTIQDLVKLMRELPNYAPDSREYRSIISQGNRIINNLTPATFGEKFTNTLKLGMLSLPKTYIINPISNAYLAGSEVALAPVKQGVDILTSAITKKPRTYTMAPLEKLNASRQGFKKGVSELGLDIKEGVDTNPYMQNVDYKYNRDLYNPNTKLGRFGNYVNRKVGQGLSAGDRPFLESAKASRLAELQKLTGKISENDISEATKYALNKYYQGNNVLTKQIQKLKQSDNQLYNVIANMIMPFTKFPVNFFGRALEYSGGGLFNGMHMIAKAKSTGVFDQRAFVDTVSRGIGGAGLIYLGSVLNKNGILTGPNPTIPKEKALWEASGKQEYSLKVGDKYYSIANLGPFAVGLLSGAVAHENGIKEDTMVNKLKGILDTNANLSVVQSMQRMFGGYDMGENVLKTIGNFSSQFTPALLRGIARGTDPYEREIDSTTDRIKSSIPLLRQTLPIKVDAYGENVKSSGLINSIFNPVQIKSATKDPVKKELLRVSKVTGKNLVPIIAENTLETDSKDYEITSNQKTELQKLIGEKSINKLSDLINGKKYNNYDDTEKAKKISSILTDVYKEEKLRYIKLNKFSPK